MVIFINGYVKANIVQALSLKTTQSIDNAITKLVKGNILKRISRGTYKSKPLSVRKGRLARYCPLAVGN